MPVILSVTLNPSIDHAVFVERLALHDTNRVTRSETDAGGKGINLSRVAAELGAETMATGFLGGGPAAFVRAVLDRQGVAHDFVPIAGDTRTNFSVEDGFGPPTTFNAPGPRVTPEEWDALVARVSALVRGASWVCLGGSLPPGAPADAYRRLAEVAERAGVPVALDADGDPLREGLRAKIALIKPNGREAARLLGRAVEGREDALAAARDLRELGVDRAIVSLGAEGAALSGPNGDFIARSPTVEAKSTIGSGDSMVAGFLVGLMRGVGDAEAFRLGLAAGAATATTDGSEIGRRETIEKLLPAASTALVSPAPRLS